MALALAQDIQQLPSLSFNKLAQSPPSLCVVGRPGKLLTPL